MLKCNEFENEFLLCLLLDTTTYLRRNAGMSRYNEKEARITRFAIENKVVGTQAIYIPPTSGLGLRPRPSVGGI